MLEPADDHDHFRVLAMAVKSCYVAQNASLIPSITNPLPTPTSCGRECISPSIYLLRDVAVHFGWIGMPSAYQDFASIMSSYYWRSMLLVR